VQEVEINTFPERDWVPDGEWEPPRSGYKQKYYPFSSWKVPQEWRAAVNQIPTLSRLKAISLRYTSDCSSPIVPAAWSEEREVLERVNLRQQYLHLLFDIMAECNATNETKITSLTIKNLQNYHFTPYLITMTSALAYLDELNIRVCTEVASNITTRLTTLMSIPSGQYLLKSGFSPFRGSSKLSAFIATTHGA
jgi:hypothetical protein